MVAEADRLGDLPGRLIALSIILHIAKRSDWTEAQSLGSYRTDSLEIEGFIHCSTPDQVIAVANFIFHGQNGLVLLAIDEAKVSPEIRFEIGNSSEDDELLDENGNSRRSASCFKNARIGILCDEVTPAEWLAASNLRPDSGSDDDKLFPHIYGPLNLDAVTQVVDFDPLPDGSFELPEEFGS